MSNIPTKQRYRIRYETPQGRALTTVVDASSEEEAKAEFDEWTGGAKAGYEWLSVELIAPKVEARRAGEKTRAVAEYLLKDYRRQYPGDTRRGADHYEQQASDIVALIDGIDRKVVADIQRVPRYQSLEFLAGLCEFCQWQGEPRPFSKEGGLKADQDARTHLGEVHPEKVTYWAEPAES